MKRVFLSLLVMWMSMSAWSQNVGIGTNAPDPSAKLHIVDPNRGVLINSVVLNDVTLATPITAPATGLLVWNTNAAVTGGTGVGYYYWDGTKWVRLLNSDDVSDDWSLLGNTGTNPTINFVGTTDGQDFVTRTNNVERVRVEGTTGNVGIGTNAPTDRLTVSNGRVEFTNTNDANGTPGTGVLEIGDALRIDNNEIITNTDAILYLQNDNNGDLRVDAGTLTVDASENSVGVGTTAPNVNAVFHANSTTKGMLIPRMTTAQRDAMGGTLPEGLIIYNTTNNCIEFWDTGATPIVGNNGFWNSTCQSCDEIVVITANQVGFNLNNYIGGAQAKHYCVYIRPGVTLWAAANGGPGSAGNPGFNATTMPTGSSITLYNYGTILAGGGDGGRGGQESDAVCQGDANGQAGGKGGDAILTATVTIEVLNYGTIRAGGGGGGGGGASCAAAGGGGGGGAGTPPGGGGNTQTTSATSGFICGCGSSTSSAGNAGLALTPGTGGAGVNRPATGCTCTGSGAGTGGLGGAPGVAGNIGGGTQRRGNGGAAGLALQGNGTGSSLSNFGTQTGAVNP